MESDEPRKYETTTGDESLSAAGPEDRPADRLRWLPDWLSLRFYKNRWGNGNGARFDNMGPGAMGG